MSNVDFCPPIELLAYFGGLGGGDNKEGVTPLPSLPKMKAMSSTDLKSVITGVMVEVLSILHHCIPIKADGDAAKVKALEAFDKKMAGQKKK